MKINRVNLSIFLLLVPALVLFASSYSRAAEVMETFDTPEQATLYQLLLREYRCLKCQNQNLADSNADLAGDLRREIRSQILAGNSRVEIDEYLVARYGEFVLYRPRFSSKTLVLWILPFALFIAAMAGLVISGRRRRNSIDESVLPNNLDQGQLEAAKRYLESP